MVTINLTLLFELGLFLLFMWGTARFILRPVLQTLDEREAVTERDRQQTHDESAEAESLEQTYADEVAQIHHDTDASYRKARQEGVRQRADSLRAARQEADAEIAATRDEALRQVKEERSALVDSVPEIADLIAERIGKRSAG